MLLHAALRSPLHFQFTWALIPVPIIPSPETMGQCIGVQTKRFRLEYPEAVEVPTIVGRFQPVGR